MNWITPIPSLKIEHVTPYNSDTGCDIDVPTGTPIRAVADGEIIYSESGHTSWVASWEHPHDTANSILMKLKAPLLYNGVTYPLVWYTHLSMLAYDVPDGSLPRKVKQGEILGRTGTGNDVPHLHFGILSHREQNEGDYMEPGTVGHIMRALIKGVKP